MRVFHVAMLLCALLFLGAASASPDGSVTATDVTGLLREFGFPIFVSLWFMWRLEKRLDAFTESIQKLLTVVTVMSKSIDEISDRPSKQNATRALEQGKDVA
jgi:hypothetical protein